VNVRVAPEVAGGALNDSDGTALPAGQAALGLALSIPRRDRVHEDAQHFAE
jgi:hypothetical protein